MLVPLIPLGLEWLFTDTLTDESVTLAASMYAILIGVSSRYKLMLGTALVVCMLFTAVYGAVTVQKQEQSREQATALDRAQKGIRDVQKTLDPDDRHSSHVEGEPHAARYYRSLSLWAIFMIFGVHVTERFNRHVLNREPFWELL
jgi:hypothetical protein